MGVQPTKNVVVVSGEQRKNSAIHTHIHMSMLPQAPHPLSQSRNKAESISSLVSEEDLALTARGERTHSRIKRNKEWASGSLGI